MGLYAVNLVSVFKCLVILVVGDFVSFHVRSCVTSAVVSLPSENIAA